MWHAESAQLCQISLTDIAGDLMEHCMPSLGAVRARLYKSWEELQGIVGPRWEGHHFV